MSYVDAGQFIRYAADPHRTIAGMVDIQGYLAWLDAHGYGIDLTLARGVP